MKKVKITHNTISIKNFKRTNTLVILCFLLLVSCKKPRQGKVSYDSWFTYRGTADANQFSSLNQIDTSNVHLLEPAWIYHTGDAGNRTTIECNPIIIDDIMYVTSPKLKLIALNAATGEEIWTFEAENKKQFGGVNRGVTYYEEEGFRSILFPSGPHLYSLDATTGKVNRGFGVEGRIDLRENLGVDDPSVISVSLTTPGIIFEDLIIIGSATGEGYNASPGHVRAYNARTGEFQWIFHTIPKEGEFGHETWDWVEGENYGGANNWGGMSLDQERGWVFVPTGSATYDFYGANRSGENLFANSLIALKAKTGERVWHYQAVHHDLWDYDLACAPNLVSIMHEGKEIDALVQPTKMGNLVLLNRETGKPLIKAQELPVPTSEIPGEGNYPTQKVNQGIIITPQGIDENYLTNVSSESHQYALQELKKYRYGEMYIPPSLQGTATLPSTRGGVLWGGASYDAEKDILYVNANEIPLILQVAAVEPQIAETDMEHEGQIAGGVASRLGKNLYLLNCANCHGADRKGVTNAFPELMALDEKYSRQEVSDIITQGLGLMPPHTGFKEKELNSLVDFLMEIDSVENDDSDYTSDSEMVKYVLQGFRLFLDQNGFPASKPPWGTLNAIDLNSRKLLWKVPLGYYPELKSQGVPDTGTQSFGGCVATAGGLVFIGASADEMFRAYHAGTGQELWNYQLPAGGYATPAVYQIAGKQYVVIAAGGGNRNGTPSGDAYIAFSLP